jgi:RNA polymerase sigma-70 factor, ECF subfamily
MEVDDRETVELIERIYEERYETFCRVATGVTRSAETARDAVQDAFALALSRSDQYRGDGPLEGWLWRIVLRSAIDARKGAQHAVGELELAGVVELPHADRDPELASALRALPNQQRLVVFLRYFADLSHAEIAAFAGIETGTVSATLHQAKQTLARRLGHATAKPEKAGR